MTEPSDAREGGDEYPAPIDIVVPHVDGRAPGYAELSAQYVPHLPPCHVRDLGELRYVLRSIAMHAPWARRIWLAVLDAGHVPSWVDRSRVHIVTHDAFLPARYRPTFHRSTILAHLHEIPDLAERFVIWVDDVVATRAVAPDSLYSPDGLPRTGVFLAPVFPGTLRIVRHGYQHVLVETIAVLERALAARAHPGWLKRGGYLYPHMPLPMRRASMRALVEALDRDDRVARIFERKHRGQPPGDPDVDPLVLLANWVEIVDRGTLAPMRFARMIGQLASALVARPARRRLGVSLPLRFGSYPIRNDPHRTEAHLERLLAERPVFASINDEAYDSYRVNGVDVAKAYDPNPVSVAALHRALERLLPDPSPFERRT